MSIRADDKRPIDTGKSLDRKLQAIHADPHNCREFILADAKDADMAFGVAAPGRQMADSEGRFRSLAEYREQMRAIVRAELVDVMLMSASSSEQLMLVERLFDNSPVTAAARVNDSTDIHILRGGRIHQAGSLPFRTAAIDHIQAGRLDPTPEERRLGTDLGLYSLTFNNDAECDRHSLLEFERFRIEAESKGFRYFLEVFDPNLPDAVPSELVGAFVNDAVVRALAGVTRRGRPLFLKIAYHGPRALEELVSYDPHLVVGILGGAAGTTRDAFQLVADVQRHGARIALFGRKINQAENQLLFLQFLGRIVAHDIEPEDAVRAYHAELDRQGLRPNRPLGEDVELTHRPS